MQIYRPPGSRKSNDDSPPSPPEEKPKAKKTPHKDENGTPDHPPPPEAKKGGQKGKGKQNGTRNGEGMKPARSNGDLTATAPAQPEDGKGPQPLFPPLDGTRSTPPPKTPPRRNSPAPPSNGADAKPRLPPRRQNSFIKLDQSGQGGAKPKPSGPKDAAEIRRMFTALDLPHSAFLDQYIEGNLESTDLAAPTAQLLVQMAIEEGRSSKSVGKLCGALGESGSGAAFHAGLVAACWQYYECRDKLRTEHFKFWLAFLNFVSDLYAALGYAAAGELVDILFRIFHFMLSSPVLDLLKIEELECLISGLMSTGYELERECPERLAELRMGIRDAFIAATEPWARKMILLLVELSASGWRLPPEANEYYFQTVSASS